ncbi:hypothetical protein IEO21_03256 [Rhodonia placenta]|uniref:Nuclear condensin complex subunit 3 C-terminal domain-containing protein n=1 Tax=Rhodonia placenta TaxID=104341 RepID=A0A8H7P666_9APHY|nr:hypothetical protein IEO21_03256 [Postia placenta]
MRVFERIPDAIPRIFNQAQQSLANHHKNCAALYKLHNQVISIYGSPKNTSVCDARELIFEETFLSMIGRVLVIKKGPASADQVVRFIGAYAEYIINKGESGICNISSTAPSHETYRPSRTTTIVICIHANEGDSSCMRFIARVLQWLLGGFTAKDKTVRYRCISIVAELVARLNIFDEETYGKLRDHLIDRTCDRESVIRCCAVVALSRLVDSEDISEFFNDRSSIIHVLLDSLCSDPSAEVRHTALLCTPLTPRTLPILLTRSQDVDPSVRKALISQVLSTMPKDAVHPRQLTLTQRERMVHDGLGDREDAVRTAARRMVIGWFDVVVESIDKQDAMEMLVQFLKLFDLASPEGNSIATDAMKALMSMRADIKRKIAFPDAFWTKLSSEACFAARVYVEYCREREDEAGIDASRLPVVTTLAYFLQEACNSLLDAIEDLEEAQLLAESHTHAIEEKEDDLDSKEDAVAEHTLVVNEMLRLVSLCDYSDEIGRKKLFAVAREMLAHELMPEDLLEPCMEILALTGAGERELIRIVVEIVADLRDGDDEYPDQLVRFYCGSIDTTQSSIRTRSLKRVKEPAEMSPEEQAKANATDVRCLKICIAMLSRVNGSMNENSTLEGILADLIIPAIKRKELALRERGLTSLGLCCLISKELAMNSLQLFLNQIQSAPEQLKTSVLHVLFDILMVHEEELLGSQAVSEQVVAFLLHVLEIEDSPAVQAALCMGIAKLMLAGLIDDERVLTSLVLIFVSPATADNHEVRQCLAYFLPAYCYLSPENQTRMQKIGIMSLNMVHKVNDELSEDEEMVTPCQFGLLLVEWTDPRHLVKGQSGTRDMHVALAIDILKTFYKAERTDDNRKTLCKLLDKLYIPSEASDLSLATLHILLDDLQKRELTEDQTLEKLLDGFRSRFVKQFGRRLKNLDINLYANEPQFRELYTLTGMRLGGNDDLASENFDVQIVGQATGPSEMSSMKGTQANLMLPQVTRLESGLHR